MSHQSSSPQLSTNATAMVALSAERRREAYENARRRVAGDLTLPNEPQEKDYYRQAKSKYPPALRDAIYVLCVVMLVVGFLPSAMRLHTVGLIAVSTVITHEFSKYVAALCIVLMAETGQVVFTLASAVTDEKKRKVRRALDLGAVICTCIALVGNGFAVFDAPMQPDNKDAFEVFKTFEVSTLLRFVFVMLETFAPPVLVLLVSSIIKSLAMNAISVRYEAQRDYEEAWRAWEANCKRMKESHQHALDSAHDAKSWLRHLANELREALRRTNAQRTKTLVALTDDDWRALVVREMEHEDWYERAQATSIAPIAQATSIAPIAPATSIAPIAPTTPIALAPSVPNSESSQETQPVRVVRSSSVRRNGTKSGTASGALTNKTQQLDNGMWIAKCPECDYTTRPFLTERSAINALVAHGRHNHKPVETEQS